MFPMTPLQSWAFLALLVLLVALIIQLTRRLGGTALDVLEDEQETKDTEVAAEVHTLRPRRQRHLHPVGSGKDADDDLLAIWRDVLNP